MANQGPSFGLSLATKRKMDGKRSPECEREMLIFVRDMTNEEVDLEHPESLKDGKILCQLINIVLEKEGKRKMKIDTGSSSFNMRVNLENFVKGCKTLGLKEDDLFQVNDLFESKNIAQFTQCVFALGRKLQEDPSYDGPKLGPKPASENKRDFTHEQMEAGKNISSLQMGSNKGASQAGQNFGQPRQIINKTE